MLYSKIEVVSFFYTVANINCILRDYNLKLILISTVNISIRVLGIF